MSTKRNRLMNPVAMESLEPRQLLDGNVLAGVLNGSLVILGDDDGNDIAITAGASAGEFIVASGASATTVNGEVGPTTFSDVTKGFRIALGKGNDVLQIAGQDGDTPAALDVAKDIIIDMGKGSSTVSLDQVSVGGSLAIISRDGLLETSDVTLNNVTVGKNLGVRAGIGDDTLTVDTLSVAGSLAVSTGWGNDEARLTHAEIGGAALFAGTDVTLAHSTVNGRLAIAAGPLDGEVSITDTTVAGRTAIFAGAGTDSETLRGSTFQGRVEILGGLGADSVTVSGCTFDGRFALGTGLGDDAVSIDGSSFAGRAEIRTGLGGDSVGLATSSFAGRVDLNTGLGNDQVAVDSGTFEARVNLNTGLGDDVVAIASSTFSARVEIFTGLGADSVSVDGSTFNERFFLYTGYGNDTVNVATASGVTFALAARFHLGTGDDTLSLGSASGVATFAGPVLFAGGSGEADVLSYDIANVSFAVDFQPVISGFETQPA